MDRRTEGENERSGMGETKPVTRCEILEDGETHQKVRLTRYESAAAAERANPGAS